MAFMTDPDYPTKAEPQFKHAMIPLAEEAFVLTPRCPELALVIFSELLHEIARVRYYRRKHLGPHNLVPEKSQSINGNSRNSSN